MNSVFTLSLPESNPSIGKPDKFFIPKVIVRGSMLSITFGANPQRRPCLHGHLFMKHSAEHTQPALNRWIDVLLSNYQNK
jgi:hypothetical protein